MPELDRRIILSNRFALVRRELHQGQVDPSVKVSTRRRALLPLQADNPTVGINGFWRRSRHADQAEAQEIAERVERLAAGRAPDALRTLVDVPDRFGEVGASGIVYQVVVEARPEDETGKVLRVSVAVDGARAQCPPPGGGGTLSR